MSQVYSRLLEVELEKHEKMDQESLAESSREEIVPIEQWVVTRERDEGKELPAESRDQTPSDKANPHPLPLRFLQWSSRFIDKLNALKTLADASRGRFEDEGFGNGFHKTMTEDITEAQAELSCFVDYLGIVSPVLRVNTLHRLMEEVLASQEKQLRERKISIFRKQFEEGLPETTVPEAELKYVLTWTLQYAINTTALNGRLGIRTRRIDIQRATEELKPWQGRNGRCVEMEILLTSHGKQGKGPDSPKGAPTSSQENRESVILSLVDEIVKKHRGALKVGVDSEKHLTRILLLLPF